jgi:hypothetical protein
MMRFARVTGWVMKPVEIDDPDHHADAKGWW